LHMLILFVLKASIVFSVFAIGLDSRPNFAIHLLRRPTQLARSLLAMDVIMPVVAVAIVWAFDLHEAVEVSLVALALSPVPPILPKKQIKARGEPSYAIGLLVVAAAVAVVFIPIAIELLGQFFQMQVHMRVWPIAQLVLMTVLAPLAVGMLVRLAAPAIASRISQTVALIAAVLLATSVLPLLFANWQAILALVGNGTVLAIAGFAFVGLGVGHMLGGPDPRDRVVLALATATRHPGIALAIGTTNFPEQKAVLPTILLYVLLVAILTFPYVLWRERALSVGHLRVGKQEGV
jgi:bile acid:Na+ symporter, BASS family